MSAQRSKAVSDVRHNPAGHLRVVHDAAGTSPPGEAPTADPRSFARRLLPHLDDAYRYARYLARDPAAAEDIVQDAYLRALKSYASCRGNEKAWLFAIVRNCCIDWRNANRLRDTFPVAEAIEEAAADDTPETELQREDEARSVRAAVAGLPEPFREAILLREFDELSYREIAAITQVPIGTVMSRLARARVQLATLFLTGKRKEMGG